MNVYVGNLSFETDDAALRAAFEAYGEVASARVITDRDTGRSRGVGFVSFDASEDADKAIEGLNGTPLDGRTIVHVPRKRMEPEHSSILGKLTYPEQ